jgi:hypothetical protein
LWSLAGRWCVSGRGFDFGVQSGRGRDVRRRDERDCGGVEHESDRES